MIDLKASDVKALIDKRIETVFTVSEGALSALAVTRPNDKNMELDLFAGGIIVIFDDVKVVDSTDLELCFKGYPVAYVDVTEWGA